MQEPRFTPTPRYVMYQSRPLNGWMVVDCAGDYRGCPAAAGDLFRSQSAAAYALRMLNSGAARINPHGTIGCRVEVQMPDGLNWD